MDCKKTQELLTSYVDGDLDNETVTLFDNHLDNCVNCKEEWSSFNKTVHYLTAMEKLRAPSDLLPGIHEKMEQQEQGFFKRLWKRWLDIDMSMSWQTGTATIAIAFTAMAIIKTFPIEQAGQVQVTGPQTQTAQTQQTTNNLQQRRKTFRLPSKNFPAASTPRFTESSQRLSYATSRAGTGSLSNRDYSQSLYEAFTRIHAKTDSEITKLYRPDIAVSAETLSFTRKNSLYKRITNDTSWHSKASDNELLIFVRPGQLKRLQHLFAQHKIVFPPTDFSHKDFNPHKKTLTIAVQL